ncbi:uncharacterized protein LOC128198759 [Bicyclus anynana]|uniref:Uncharacterized protein LOC128198759 n=1 Tax=Bicyclus anynana TaxID=110368 RepID=A0ABM3LR67_BICAN|nr:uncharacterized protein LOC128198759 [Bicyclus anynana]
MSEQDIDIDFLISLVQERPIIWDKSHEHYSDKFRKANEWVAVCKKIFQDYEEFEDQKKNKIGNEVVKKWRSVKDNFFRYVKKIKENSSSGSGAKQLKKYHYYNQLLFLMKVAQNKTDSSLEMVSEETERNENTASSSPFPTKEMSSLPPGPSRYVPASRKRSNQAIDDFEAQALKALQEKENRHLSFFKGILPSLDSFTELQTLTFQSKVINIITEIRFGDRLNQQHGSHADIKLDNSIKQHHCSHADIKLDNMPSHHRHHRIEQMNSKLPTQPTLRLIILLMIVKKKIITLLCYLIVILKLNCF